MGIPIQRVDPDQLIVDAGKLQGFAERLRDDRKRGNAFVTTDSVANAIDVHSGAILACAGYIRYLEDEVDVQSFIAKASARHKVLLIQAIRDAVADNYSSAARTRLRDVLAMLDMKREDDEAMLDMKREDDEALFSKPGDRK